MARIDTGNNLAAAVQQPGAKVNEDGFGLITCTVVWKQAIGTAYSSVTNRGGSCPVTGPGPMTSHKWQVTEDALGIATITVDYAGIDSTYFSGVRTQPEVRASQGLTTEHITTHPNFFTAASGFTGGVIAGVGTGTTTTPVYAVNASGTFDGANGSTFQEITGGKFLGFQKALYPELYGKSSYLAPITSFAGHFYTTTAANVTGLIARVGKTSSTNQFNGITLLPAYMGTSFVNSAGDPQLLLSQINVEDFADLYKVNYEIRFNRQGYDGKVYAPS